MLLKYTGRGTTAVPRAVVVWALLGSIYNLSHGYRISIHIVDRPAPPLPIPPTYSLFQVLVPTDPKYENTFVLSSLPGQAKSIRDRSFRAETRLDMTQWLRVLVAASLVAQ